MKSPFDVPCALGQTYIDIVRCARCGEVYIVCNHHRTAVTDMSADEATRVRARYAFGKLHNPDHDITSYRDQPTNPQRFTNS